MGPRPRGKTSVRRGVLVAPLRRPCKTGAARGSAQRRRLLRFFRGLGRDGAQVRGLQGAPPVHTTSQRVHRATEARYRCFAGGKSLCMTCLFMDIACCRRDTYNVALNFLNPHSLP
ncbi:hypothetical protein L227DRAFT_604588, partial [Lentinus tigrinus ALCF2SS1-6]